MSFGGGGYSPRCVYTPAGCSRADVHLYRQGLNTTSEVVVYNSQIQSQATDEVWSRVFTIFDVTWNAVELLSLAIAGVVADQFSVNVVYYLGGSLRLFTGLTGLKLFKAYQLKFNTPALSERS